SKKSRARGVPSACLSDAVSCAAAGRVSVTLESQPRLVRGEVKAMRRIRIALVVALFAGAAVSLHAEALVPPGTPIVMTLDQSVSSKDARTGQKVDCTVAQNVVVGGKTVIPKGSKGSCSVASVQASGHLKTPAKLWLK